MALQKLDRRFESGRRLQAWMVELVDTQDLKSCGSNPVRVRFPLQVKFLLLFWQSFFWGCLGSFGYAIKKTTLPIQNCPSSLLFVEIWTSDKKGNGSLELSYENNYNSLPRYSGVDGISSNTLLLYSNSGLKQVQAKVFCESSQGLLLFDSKKIGFKYYNDKGQRLVLPARERLYFLDDPLQKLVPIDEPASPEAD